MFKRYVASKRHTMQIDFDDYLVALAKERKAGEERAQAQGHRLPVAPPRRGGRGVTGAALAGGRRERTKAANRAAILSAGQEVFAELGYGASSVRHIVRRTDLAAGTFYNYFPDKEAVFRALVHEVGEEARRRVRAARRAARTPREFVEDAYRAYFGFIVEDAAARRLPVAQRRRDPRDVRGVRGAGRDRRARRGPARGDRARRAAGGRRRLLRGGDGRGRARARPAARGARCRPTSRARRASRPSCSWVASSAPRVSLWRMPTRLLVAAACAVLLALAAPAAAPAALKIGIAENKPNLFSDPLFTDLGVKYTRVVVSYNVMTSGDDEQQRVADYVNGAAALGVEPLVTFEHARGGAEICNKRSNRRKKQCRLPTREAVRAQLQALPRALPAREDLRAVERGQPLHAADRAQPEGGRALHRHRAPQLPRLQDRRGRHPRPGRQPRVKRPTYRATMRYIQRFKKALKAPRTICGLHNYSDTNRFRDRGTKAIIKALQVQGDLAHGDGRHLQVPPPSRRPRSAS